MDSYYGQPPQREENNNLGIAVGALGAGALAGFGGRALFKNIDARRAKSKATGGPRGGQGGAITRDNPTAAEVYGTANKKYPDPGVGKDVQYQFPTGGTDDDMLMVDKATGEYIRRGGATAASYAELENIPKIKTAAYEEGSAVDKLMKSLLPEVNKEAGQMTATESSRQTRALAKQDEQATQSMARGILSELKEEQPAAQSFLADMKANVSSPNPEKLARIEANRQKDLQRLGNYMSEVLEAEVDEGIYDTLPAALMEIKNKAEQGNITADTVNDFRNWSNATFKNDPVVLGEINEQLDSFNDIRKVAPSQQPETLVQVQESREPLVAVNSMETVNTADDQSDGRFLRNLQRNEDVNMAAVSEAVVDSKEAVLDSRVKDALSYLRGKEIDTNFDYSTEEAIQARQVGQRFERAQALQSLGNQVIDEVQAEGVITKPVEAAQDFLTTRREALEAAGAGGPARIEQALAADIVGKTDVGARAMADVATPSNLKKYESVSNLGPDAVVKKPASGTSIRGRSRNVDQPAAINRQRSSTPEFQDSSVSVIGEPFEQGVDTQSVVSFTNEPTQAVKNLPTTGQRKLTGELTQLTPEQKDIVYGVDTVRGALPLGEQGRAPRGPVRKYQQTLTEAQEELVDTDGGGVGLGVYGLETDYTPGAVRYDGSYSAASEQQPTTYRVSPRKAENAPNAFAGLSDDQLGQVSMQGTEAEAYNADKMLAKRRSFDVSQDIRRIQNSGRPDAQKQVKSYLDELMANEIPGVDFS